MLTAIEGYVKNGQMVINENISAYEGRDFIITFLRTKEPETTRKKVSLSAYGERTEWGQNVEAYMEEMREMTDFHKVFVDTSPYIYFLNHNDNFYNVTKAFFEYCQNKDIPMVTSVITKEEYSVMPYRTGNMKWLKTFHRFLSDTKTEVLDINDIIADEAAQIRAKYTGFKAMDSLQLASAITVGADLFLTNDKQLKQFDKIKVITLEELPVHIVQS